MQKGYKEVYWFKGGLPAWRSFGYGLYENKKYVSIKVQKISPRKLYERLQGASPPYVLDVRPLGYTMDEPFVKGAVSCPLVYLHSEYTTIPKDRPLVIVDWLNKKSIIAAKYLFLQGYQVEGVLKGGVQRWIEEKLPTRRGPADRLGPLDHLDELGRGL